jgi:uncharacterized circularly permuted ATP-grasp superfamily protein/uncharacterized alpha-E superfamily protein
MKDVPSAQPASPPDVPAFLGSYRRLPGVWDELVAGDGQPRPVAQPLVDFLARSGPEGRGQRADQVRQLLRDHGVSYNVPAEGPISERPWRLDLLPTLLDGPDFAVLAKGLAERARLLDRILQDLYGPQQLIRKGFLPARLVLGNPSFLRPCHGIELPRRLHLYAADVVRTRDGGFSVLRDRTQAPTGAGYALADRLVISHALEEPFQRTNILRLAAFFRTLRESLAALSPLPREDPNVVVLSSGTSSPTYFEQAFLAQYLGYPTVEGGDLAVRERRVCLKTLGGLTPVDVIVRQVADDYCDPLELRAESQLGVPGLVEATRARQVAVANSLGSGLVQSPALLPFLTTIARDFFGEELSLASPPAYWCGDGRTLDHVLAHADDMVFRPTWPGAGPVHAGALSGERRAAFLAEVTAMPERYVAQERVAVALAPVLASEAMVPRRSVLRGYAVCAGEDYVVMPGGLSLVAPEGDDTDVAVGRGALAKDVWVRGEVPADHFSLLPPASRSVELSRGGADLPSRSADNLFWFGRYTERAEALARLARHLLGRLADEGDRRVPASAALSTLFEVIGVATDSPPLALAQGQPLVWLAAAMCSSELSGSLRNLVRAATRSAGAVRDRLSADTFRVLGALAEEAERAAVLLARPSLVALTTYLDRIVTSLSALSGLAMESMTRGHGWRFLDMGRRLERAMQLLSLLRAAFAAGAESNGTLLETLLAVADSSMTYRRRYLAGLHPAAVVDLLLVDEGNPRAVLFQIEALREHLRRLPHDGPQARLRSEERLALASLTRLQLLDVGPACQPSGDQGPQPLQAVLREVESDLSRLSDELCGTYLNHALMPRPLAGSVEGR